MLKLKITPLSLKSGGTYPDLLKRAVPVFSRAARAHGPRPTAHGLLIKEHEGNDLLRKSGYVQLSIIQLNVPEG